MKDTPENDPRETSFSMLNDKHEIVRVRFDQIDEWEKWFLQVDNRRVGRDVVEGYLISTVFLCIDHGFGGTPKWFETMIFKGENLEDSMDRYQWRYTTWEEAEIGHKSIVELVRIGALWKQQK
jgi:hypothetical protein